MAAAVEFTSLHLAYSEVGDCCGFQHFLLDQKGARQYETYDLSIQLWQYDHKLLTSPFQIGLIDYTGNRIEDAIEQDPNFTSEGSVNVAGSCHAIVTWVEYVGVAEATQASDSSECITSGKKMYPTNVLCTNDSYHVQMVRFLNQRPTLAVGDILGCKFAANKNETDETTESYSLTVHLNAQGRDSKE
jgi:hypothetical protein